MGGQLSEAHKVLQWDRLFSLSSALVHFPEKRQVWKQKREQTSLEAFASGLRLISELEPGAFVMFFQGQFD